MEDIIEVVGVTSQELSRLKARVAEAWKDYQQVEKECQANPTKETLMKQVAAYNYYKGLERALNDLRGED